MCTRPLSSAVLGASTRGVQSNHLLVDFLPYFLSCSWFLNFTTSPPLSLSLTLSDSTYLSIHLSLSTSLTHSLTPSLILTLYLLHSHILPYMLTCCTSNLITTCCMDGNLRIFDCSVMGKAMVKYLLQGNYLLYSDPMLFSSDICALALKSSLLASRTRFSLG